MSLSNLIEKGFLKNVNSNNVNNFILCVREFICCISQPRFLKVALKYVVVVTHNL